MEIPDYEPFYLHTSDELRAEIARLGLAIPVEENFDALAQPIIVGGRRIAIAFARNRSPVATARPKARPATSRAAAISDWPPAASA